MDYGKKFNDLMKWKVRINANFASFEKVALYDFNGTLVEMKGTAGIYERKIREMLEPMMGTAKDRKIANYAVEKIKSPRRGTKAREVYYDFLELAIERGEVKMIPFPDVFMKGNAIERDMRAGLKIISFSRGTDILMVKSIEASKTGTIIEKMYSSIPYGGEKTAECYFGFFADLLKGKKLIAKSYEDEWGNVADMLIAEMALSAKTGMPQFEINWVDRKGIQKSMKTDLELLGNFYETKKRQHGWKFDFKEILKVKSGLF
ncbi:MAG: hypothetical protein V1835_06460 [Candidatus Micrarchaeota archaeon]